MWGDNVNYIKFNVNILKYYWIFFESEIYLIICLVILLKENVLYECNLKIVKMKKEYLFFNVYV